MIRAKLVRALYDLRAKLKILIARACLSIKLSKTCYLIQVVRFKFGGYKSKLIWLAFLQMKWGNRQNVFC